MAKNRVSRQELASPAAGRTAPLWARFGVLPGRSEDVHAKGLVVPVEVMPAREEDDAGRTRLELPAGGAFLILATHAQNIHPPQLFDFG